LSSEALYNYGFRYYNPVSQRWLNRDPIGERGGINLYRFTRNNPVKYIDKYGHYSIGAGYGCLYEQKGPSPCEKAQQEAKSMMGAIVNDKRAHCISSCQIAKACGPRTASLLGDAKESRDLFMGGIEWTASWILPKSGEEWLHDHIGGGSIDDSAGDFEANFYGLDMAKSGKDCVKECEKRYGPEP
jgi:hypothetical protein